MDSIINQVTSLAKGADERTRKKIINALLELSYSIETPDDTMTRLWSGHIALASVRTGIDLKLFNLLVNSATPMSLSNLADVTGADPVLLGRLCRHLAALLIIKETGLDEYSATNITKTIATAGNEACIKHNFDTCGPCFQAMPEFLQKHGYHNPTDSHKTVFQDAWKCDQTCFEWIMARPDSFENLNLYMASRREKQASWIDYYKLNTTNLSPERALFVDMGGSIGHQCAEFKARYPDLPGRVILQDLPFAVEHAIPTPNVENMAHDFFTSQPIRGAKYYYMRAVMHDWPDNKCRTILDHIKDVLAPDSVILIDDMVAPNQGVNWQVCQIDLTMMAAVASMERTESQWQSLFDSVGLKVVDRAVYTPGMYETVTAVVPK